MVNPNPGFSGIAIIPSFASTVSSIRSWIIGLAPSEYSTVKLAGEAAQTCRPAKKQGAPAHRCGAKRRLKALAMVPIFIASLMPPQKAGIGLEDVGGLQHGEIAEGIARRLALAGGDRDGAGGAHFGHARLVVGDHRLLEPGEIEVADEVDEALGFGHRIGAVGIDHQVDIGTERLARGADAGGGNVRRRRPWRRPASSAP